MMKWHCLYATSDYNHQV